MKKKNYVNLTVFIIFFLAALVDALTRRDWVMVIIFTTLGVWSYLADVKLD